MRLELWQVNSAALGMLIVAFMVNMLLYVSPPTSPRRRPRPAHTETSPHVPDYSFIYTSDLFGTYTPPSTKEKPLVPPVPKLDLPSGPPDSDTRKPSIISPLNVKLNGILYSSDEWKSIALVIDESGKEATYHTGESIKDGQIIKISPKRVTLIRSNGQQEVLFLATNSGANIFTEDPVSFDRIIQQEDDSSFTVDPTRFVQIIPSLGHALEELNIITAFDHDKNIGVYIDTVKDKSIFSKLGLKQGDVITAINNHQITSPKERYRAYQDIIHASQGDTITTHVKRNKQHVTLHYTLNHIDKPVDFSFNTPPPHAQLSALQKETYSSRRRSFFKEHPADRQKMIENLRAHLLENMKQREHNTRMHAS